MKYMKRRGLKLFAVAALLPVMATGMPAQNVSQPAPAVAIMSAEDAATVKQVTQLVRDFLANVPKNDPKIFEVFFADDVLYTRSAGVTVNKAEILKNIGVRAANEPQATYDADDFTVHPYGDVAVVNFRLIQHNGAVTNYFRNTGTFLKRNGKWQAVAWQATRVPPAEIKP
ncbi:MAG TPA: nuclear transport factor 2 family protein [Candidatus Angelobacter sp.]|nr:nuclear transport factor 2 family protein [Candidatus Angelobacter sp.]